MKTSASLHQVFIGLGCNQDIPSKQLQRCLRAVSCLPKVRVAAVSHLYWNKISASEPDFVHAVAKLFTSLPALELSRELHAIKNAAEANLHLDLLLYGRLQIKSASLELPHPELDLHNFWLHPLNEIAPDLLLPDETPVAELALRAGRGGLRFCRAFGLDELDVGERVVRM